MIDVGLSALLAIATAALAIFTARLFGETRDVAARTGDLARETNGVAQRTAELAKDTVNAALLADRHHQEQLSPVVVLEGLSVTYLSTPSTQAAPTFRVGELLSNLGSGPALRVTIDVQTDSAHAIFEAGFLMAGEKRPGPFILPCETGSTRADGSQSPAFTVKIWARNFFGSICETIHEWDATGKPIDTRYGPLTIQHRSPIGPMPP